MAGQGWVARRLQLKVPPGKVMKPAVPGIALLEIGKRHVSPPRATADGVTALAALVRAAEASVRGREACWEQAITRIANRASQRGVQLERGVPSGVTQESSSSGTFGSAAQTVLRARFSRLTLVSET